MCETPPGLLRVALAGLELPGSASQCWDQKALHHHLLAVFFNLIDIEEIRINLEQFSFRSLICIFKTNETNL